MDIPTATEIAFKNGYKKAVRDIFEEIDRIRALEICLYKRELEGIYDFNNEYAELKKKYMEV